MILKIILLLIIPSNLCIPREIVKWTQLSYATDGNFIPYNNVPQGFYPYKNKIFIAVPRRSTGILSTLNYIDLNENETSINPKLHSYPNIELNDINLPLNDTTTKRIVSVYRPRIDNCDRLWAVDTGVVETQTNPKYVQTPSIWIFDLKTDTILHRYEIPSSVVKNGLGLASITLDVVDCANTFAYIPDLVQHQLLVYSFNDDDSWSFSHNYFHMNPFQGDYKIAGERFSWDDGIFSITLGKPERDTFRMAYFHPMSSFSEFAVSTQVLRDRQLSKRSYHGDDFKFIGNRGFNSQSTMHSYDPTTKTIFYSEIHNNAVTCWNTEHVGFNHKDVVFQNNETMIYGNDLNVVDGKLWFMSNRMPKYIYSKLDPNDYNFRIFMESTRDAVKDKRCGRRKASKIDRKSVV